jgi:hypothetical protein
MWRSSDYITAACGIAAIVCQLLFIIGWVRNMIIRRSLIGWIFPDGTTRKEKIYLAITLALVIFLRR